MATTERAGGCLCGKVRFVARGAPNRVGLCHCTTCQKNTGTAFHAFAVFPRDAVTIEGALASYRAGPVARQFCPDCGTLILFDDEPDELDLAIGAFDERFPIAPDYELFVGSAQPWMARVKGTRRYAGNRDGEPLDDT